MISVQRGGLGAVLSEARARASWGSSLRCGEGKCGHRGEPVQASFQGRGLSR